MHDAGKVITGLAIFLVLVTAPIWLGAFDGTKAAEPEMAVPDPAVFGTECVLDKDYMRREHMQVLNEWRDDVVRRGDRIHVSHDGKKYIKSLSRTCLGCHEDVENFCYKCHDYTGVKPYCWTCHIDRPEGDS